jgi:predicted amidohydrolase
MRLAAAQSISVPGDVPANVLIHLQFIAAAQEAGVDLLVFPELSLSGYELPLLADCLVQPDDAGLAPIREQVRASGMIVVVGAPVTTAGGKPAIGAISFFPDGGYSIYRKQYLHPNEETFATSGAVGCRRHAIGGESFALGICADTNHQQHAEAAAASGASLYLTSVLFSVTAYAEDAGKLRRYAQQFDMGVLMANHGGRSGAYQSAGRSAFWAPGGEPVVAAPGTGNTLVIASKGASGWRGEVLAVEVTVPGF